MKVQIKIFALVWIFSLLSAATALPDSPGDSRPWTIAGNGRILHWLVAGPFEQPITGFGTIGDSDPIGEAAIEPAEGAAVHGVLNEDSLTHWFLQSADGNGYVDFNRIIAARNPGKIVSKIRFAKAAYAYTQIISEKEQQAQLLIGSNSGVKIYLNSEKVHYNPTNRTARPEQDTLRIRLKRGVNRLLVKVWNSHYNLNMPFFNGVDWGWGFFARITDNRGQVPDQLKVSPPLSDNSANFSVIPTFFFKKSANGLVQDFDVEIYSAGALIRSAELEVKIANRDHKFKMDAIAPGLNRRRIELPEIEAAVKAQLKLKLGQTTLKKTVQLRPEKKYQVHLMMLTHMDIGYTHPQPLCKELHIKTLDQVLDLCQRDPEFKWTIETVWILEQYRQARPPEQYNQLIELIKSGRIALSPLYSNPFSGWIGAGELTRTFAKAAELKRQFGLTFKGAVYNDTPGLNWVVPGALKSNGIDFLACGINEIYGGYSLQQALPKVFFWQGSDGSKIITYRNEAYDEGRQYGFEKSITAMEYRFWQRFNIMEAWGYPYDLILLNTALIDNGGIPVDQYQQALKWNKTYAYPKIVISNINQFSEAFTEKYAAELPVLKGDWTSAWDIYFQGEAERISRQRQAQHNLLSARKMAAINWLRNPRHLPPAQTIDAAYEGLLSFSGHGSGLEAGLGSPEENQFTMNIRENYIDNAVLRSQAAANRALYRLMSGEEAIGNEGLLVFNSLSWRRDAVVEFQFPDLSAKPYRVIDPVKQRELPVTIDGNRLFFIAHDLPALGFRKYTLIPQNRPDRQYEADLKRGADFIENRYYRIELEQSGQGSASKVILKEIYDKKLKKSLIRTSSNFPFAQPVRAVLYESSFKTFEQHYTNYEIIDQRPVRLAVKLTNEDNLFRDVSYTLWDNIDRIDAAFAIDTEKLPVTQNAQEYGIPFNFNVDDAKASVEILGGFLNPDKQLFPGIKSGAFSIRRSVALHNETQTLHWSATDSRVIFLQHNDQHNAPVIVANPLNNFPERWNRHDRGQGLLTFRFSFAGDAKSFEAQNTSRFGWESATPVQVYYNLYRPEPAEKSFFQIEGKETILLNMETMPEQDQVIVYLQNTNPEQTTRAVLISDLIEGRQIFESNYFHEKLKPLKISKNRVNIKLRPNEIKCLIIGGSP